MTWAVALPTNYTLSAINFLFGFDDGFSAGFVHGGDSGALTITIDDATGEAAIGLTASAPISFTLTPSP